MVVQNFYPLDQDDL